MFGDIFSFMLSSNPAAWVANMIPTFFNAAATGQAVATNLFGNAIPTIQSYLGSAYGDIIVGMLNTLPSGGAFPTVFHSAAIYFGNCLQSVAFFVPVDALVYCMTLSFSVMFTLWSLHFVRLIINFVRGIPTDNFEMTY